MAVFDTDAHVEECEETFAALQDRPELAGTAPRVPPGGSKKSDLPARNPGEYVEAGRVFFSCELDEARIGPVAQVIGDDCILYSSDLPHAHRVFDAIRVFGERSDVSQATKAKILANGARFFGP